MNHYARRHPKPRYGLGVRVVIAITGLIMSVVLHELFHILVHWGHITSIGFFTDAHTIVQVIVDVPNGYNVNSEELVAYMITGIVIVITTIVVWHLTDVNDRRTLSQTLDIGDGDLDDINVDEVLNQTPRKKTPPAPRPSLKVRSKASDIVEKLHP